MATPQTAAFVRAEGLLVPRRATLAAAAFFAGNGQGFRERALRIGQLAIAAPVFELLAQNDRTRATRAAWVSLRGMSEDRLCVLAEEYFEERLAEKVMDPGLDLIRQARDRGHRIVLVSEGITHLMAPLVERLGGIDELCANRLEIRDGELTGRLLDPVIGGHETGRWITDWAEKHDVDLGRSVAYGVHGTDLLMLAAVGQPCVVNPDYTLRRAAKEADWPVVEYRT